MFWLILHLEQKIIQNPFFTSHLWDLLLDKISGESPLDEIFRDPPLGEVIGGPKVLCSKVHTVRITPLADSLIREKLIITYENSILIIIKSNCHCVPLSIDMHAWPYLYVIFVPSAHVTTCRPALISPYQSSLTTPLFVRGKA